jgi:2'-5' RNA ligase
MAVSWNTDEIWKNYFDVVILPPPSVRDYAIALSAQLQKHGSKFVLGRRRYLPHISLYHIPVRPENFNDFCVQVQEVVESSSGGELKLQSIQLPLLMTDKPSWLKTLHLDLIKNTNRLFDWDYGAEDSWSSLSIPSNSRVRAKGYIKKYGSPFVGTLFAPHITLASFEDKSVVDEIAPLTFIPMSFRVDTIHICELGPSHSCQRIIQELECAR